MSYATSSDPMTLRAHGSRQSERNGMNRISALAGAAALVTYFRFIIRRQAAFIC
jgi:hypothetical protein